MRNFIICILLLILLWSAGKITDYDKCIGEIRNAQTNLVKMPQTKTQRERTTSKCEGNKNSPGKIWYKVL